MSRKFYLTYGGSCSRVPMTKRRGESTEWPYQLKLMRECKKDGRHPHIVTLIVSALLWLFSPVPSLGQKCDATVWQHIYHPERLRVIQRCVQVVGVIEDATATQKHPRKDGVRHEPDGDPHGWLNLDTAFQNLINDGNRKAEQGNLVYEIPCMFPVKQADAKAACSGYHSTVKLAPVGCRVQMTGDLVQDMEKALGHFQWNELHPVYAIDILECPKLAMLDCPPGVRYGKDGAEYELTPTGFMLWKIGVLRFPLFTGGCVLVTKRGESTASGARSD